MNNAIPLYDWSTTGEPGIPRLQGRIDANTHPLKREAGLIVTTRIVEANGRIIRTRSGSLYKLENPDPKFLQWLVENGYRYDENDPIGFGKDSRKAP